MTQAKAFDGIAGVEGYEPVGVALTVGVKPAGRGFPIEKDRFHLMEPREGADGKRRPHPSFDWFNGAPPEKRRVIPAIIAHGDWSPLDQEYRAYRSNRQNENPAATAATFCRGDGVTAIRFNGAKGQDDFRTIQCLGENCQYRQVDGKNAPPCKPTTRALFRLDWHEATIAAAGAKHINLLCKYTTGSWHTYKAIRGLRDSLDNAARSIGLVDAQGNPAYSPLGFRFTLTLTEGAGKMADGTGVRFPYCYATALESPVDFLARSLKFQHAIRQQVQTALGDYDASEHRTITGSVEGK